MASTVINTREDLDAITGTIEHDVFMATLRGTLYRLEKDDQAGVWRAVEDNSVIERFGFTRAAFPGAVAPELPAYVPPPTPTQAEIIAKYESALDAHLDAVAKAHRYNDRFSFALRAGFVGPYQSEGIVFATWMDTCNVQAFALLQSVLDGTAELPTIEDFIAALPTFVLP